MEERTGANGEEERRLEAEEEARITRSLAAFAAVVRVVGKRRGFAGTLLCPCCEQGTLSYTVSGYNGHIWGKCSTPDCAEWVQ